MIRYIERLRPELQFRLVAQRKATPNGEIHLGGPESPRKVSRCIPRCGSSGDAEGCRIDRATAGILRTVEVNCHAGDEVYVVVIPAARRRVDESISFEGYR